MVQIGTSSDTSETVTWIQVDGGSGDTLPHNTLFYPSVQTNPGSTVYIPSVQSSQTLTFAWNKVLVNDLLDFIEKDPELADRFSRIIAAAIHGT